MTTPAPRFTVHPSAREPGDGIWFAVPAGFCEVNVDSLVAPEGASGVEDTADALASAVSAAPDDFVREAFVAQLARAQEMFRALRSKGTSHCSLGLHSDDSGGGKQLPLLSLFTVTWVDAVWAPRRITVGRAVANTEGQSNIEYMELGCGPVTFSEVLRTPSLGSELASSPLLQLHAHFAHPDGRTLVLLTLSTTALDHCESYRAILRQIVATAGFESPLAQVPIRAS
ncbi:hypothetical protein [Streptomyces sp. NPDC102487]|uniref:hypothetical protein n=1 Tax=Streptomyces sp. NPDC102487 TaxID=3366182 RepID=UPI00382006B2